MRNIKNSVAAIAAALVTFSSCTVDYVPFELQPDYLEQPVSISNITSEALPGQIKLKWEVPAETAYRFVKVSYYDPLQDKEVSKLASVWTDTMMIDNTRKKFGEYEFRFQTFNDKGEGSGIQSFKAVSDAAPKVEKVTSVTKLSLKAEQLSLNADPIEGKIADLVDGSLSTYINTPWQGADMAKAPFYLQVALEQPLQNFKVGYSMPSSKATGPKKVKLEVSSDGEQWTEMAVFSSGLVTGKGQSWLSDIIRAEVPFTHVRWTVELSTSGGKYAWNMSELNLYEVQLEIYDPEAE